MPRMPRKDSSQLSRPLDLDLSDELKPENETPQDSAPSAPVEEKQASSTPDPAPAADPKDAAPVDLVYDPSFPVPDGTDTVSVSVAGTPVYVFPISGDPVAVPAADAALIAENSPAVKEAN